MARQSALTLEYLTAILLEQNLITAEQRAMVLAKAKAQEALLTAGPQAGGRRLHRGGDVPSPAQILASFNLETPGGNGRILSEDAITEALALFLKIPYLKIDPLKLDRKSVV